ncbi:hypothetical protein BAUCODRAFT_183486 [Baudoinia panamericana UAMH 10762]|uniref:C2H2-type domain-containing protein n=1 Tax=Baudoinia panamericana (strain UAMH 10762) TaxID=717646 RepID=M2N9E6_BAUPA|nr:uncharacterized protein BAUCODRAFT_183486 [Baudoinia panamericana UAMH 10762]EMD00804.1 hypothetical protein BAUCODRAFT_183486 [Baudoinia panamericana UAMH 10762]
MSTTYDDAFIRQPESCHARYDVLLHDVLQGVGAQWHHTNSMSDTAFLFPSLAEQTDSPTLHVSHSVHAVSSNTNGGRATMQASGCLQPASSATVEGLYPEKLSRCSSRNTGSATSPQRSTTASTQHNCSICGYGFSTSQDLEQHAKATFHRTFKCDAANCTRTYYRRDSLARHMSMHTKKGAHECYICAQIGQRKQFVRRDHLSQHIRNVHSAVIYDSWSLESPDFSQADYSYPSVKGDCQAQAISDFESALVRIVGPDELAVMTDRLDLRSGQTEQVAKRLREFIAHADPCFHCSGDILA